MQFDSAFYSQRGGRPVNEDTAAVLQNSGRLLALAADGLGGMGGGDVASGDAIDYLSEKLSGANLEEDLLCNAILEENGRIVNMHADGSRMMTTIAVLWSDGTQTLAATVGDTRLYQFRSGQIIFQSLDHSAAQLAVFSGEITQAQLRRYPGRNRLLRALGAAETVQVSLEELEIQPGDRFLLCTDGFWELVLENEMLQWDNADTAASWLQRLEALAAARCGQRSDNNSAVAVIVTEGPENVE